MPIQPGFQQAKLARVIRGQLIRMSLVLAAMAGLLYFAFDFVHEGVKANLLLNAAIITMFGIGIALSFRRVLKITSDSTGFAALQEAFEDARHERTDTIEDPYWRHYRCIQPGIVFVRPKSIGHVFDIAYDELLRAKSVNISVSTMRSVVDGIEQRLADERGQLSYLANLLVFLGLIGTFIGLMEMVGSVGGIIGSLNTSTAAPQDAMKSLLASLQVPLKGMATGFSSSLFGLFGSLVIGMLSKFGNSAIDAMKEEFSTWLATVSHLEPGKGDTRELARLIADGMSGTGGGSGGSVGGISDVGVVATMAQGFGRMNSGMDAVSNILPRIVEIQEQGLGANAALMERFDRLLHEQAEMREHLATLVIGQQTHSEFLQELINQQRNTETKLTSGFNGMAHIMEVTGQAYLDGLRRLTSENYETNARLAKLLDLKAAGDKIAEVAIGIESKVKTGFGGLSSAMERTAQSVEVAVQAIAAEQAEMKQMLQGGNAGGEVSMSRDFEERLANGFTELSRSFETVFAAYSTIINRSLVQQAMDGGASGPAPVAVPNHAAPVLPEHENKSAAKPEATINHDELRRKLYATALQQRGGAA